MACSTIHGVIQHSIAQECYNVSLLLPGEGHVKHFDPRLPRHKHQPTFLCRDVDRCGPCSHTTSLSYSNIDWVVGHQQKLHYQMEHGKASGPRPGPARKKFLIVVLEVGSRLIEATDSAPRLQSQKSLIVVLKLGSRLIKAIGGRRSNRQRTTTNTVPGKKSLIVKIPLGARMADVETAMNLASKAEIHAAADRLLTAVEMSEDEVDRITKATRLCSNQVFRDGSQMLLVIIAPVVPDPGDFADSSLHS